MFDPVLPVDSDDDVLRLVREVLELDGTAEGGDRTTWLLMLDDTARPLPQLIPIADMPPDPDDVDRFAATARMIAEACDAEHLIIVWQRLGSGAIRMQEADWAAAVAATDLPLRAQLLATQEGVRLLDPDFEGIVAI